MFKYIKGKALFFVINVMSVKVRFNKSTPNTKFKI